MSNATRIAVSAAAALALAAPASQARPAVEAPTYDTIPATPATTSHPGFDWGDAAIGGGAVLGLVALMSAGAAVTVRARTTPAR
jgi:hypothetical protein